MCTRDGPAAAICPEPPARQSGSLGKHTSVVVPVEPTRLTPPSAKAGRPMPLASETPPGPLPRTASETQGTSGAPEPVSEQAGVPCASSAWCGTAVRSAASASSQTILGPGFALTCPCPPPGRASPASEAVPAWWCREVFPWREGQLFETAFGGSCRLAFMGGRLGAGTVCTLPVFPSWSFLKAVPAVPPACASSSSPCTQRLTPPPDSQAVRPPGRPAVRGGECGCWAAAAFGV